MKVEFDHAPNRALEQAAASIVPSSEIVDTSTNGTIAALLRDLAAVQKNQQSTWGYKRAAAAILDLDEPIENYLRPDGTLKKIPHVGPKSEQIVLEVLRHGTSATVEQAVAASGKSSDIERRRGLRDNFLTRAQVVAALRNTRLHGPSLADYHGDLQMHSVWSDGGQTFEEIAEAALARGYQYCAVTDHSYGLKIAHGVSMADLARQQKAIDKVNRAYRSRFRLIKGIEANIRPDGTVDMTPDELAQLELVVAAPHSVLRKEEDQTARTIAAVRTSGVHILGHPRGRMYGSRPGVAADWDAVFPTAADEGVAVEIDHELARRAVAAGCLVALDNDAHATDELSNAEIAIAHAWLAGVPKDRVINCWPLDRLMAWLKHRRSERRSEVASADAD